MKNESEFPFDAEKAKENENDCEIASKMKEERRTRPSDW